MPLSTANDRAIAEIIARLLNHFGTAEEPAPVRAAIAEDWLEDLREFTLAQVRWAATEWRRAQSFRPTIADIRRLATHAQHLDLERIAIADQRPGELDRETLKLWSQPQYHGDIRTPQQRRNAATTAQDEKYARAAAYRAGKLDAYDAVHHPERLAKRNAAKPTQSLAAEDLGEHAAAE